MINFSNLLPLAETFWMPDQASSVAAGQDAAFNIILYVTAFFFVLVVGLMTTFIIKYRRRSVHQQALTNVTHNTPLEIAWTGIPLLIVMAFFVMGFKGYLYLDQPPSGAMAIQVDAKQWAFTFTYPNGGVSNNLYVPKDQPVVLVMHSSDVTHAVYVPAFRVQRNVVPGRTTTLWFTATQLSPPTGFTLFCTQYCGQGHSQMGSGNPNLDAASFVYVLDKPAWDKKMVEVGDIFHDPVTKKALPYVKVGARLYAMIGCSACHSVDGSVGKGPSWKGLYRGDKGVHYTAGGVPGEIHTTDSPAVWDAYIRESILFPSAKIVDTFQDVMTNFSSQLTGSPENEKRLAAIMEYIKSLGPNYDPSQDPGVKDAAATSASAPATQPTTGQ